MKRVLPALVVALTTVGGATAPVSAEPAAAQPGPATAPPAPPPAPSMPAAPATEQWRTGTLFLPYAGLHSLQGAAAQGYGTGGRLGALGGARLRDALSVNLEPSLDFLNPAATLNGVDGWIFALSVSPLLHVSAGPTEIVVGPKLSFWTSAVDVKSGASKDAFSSTGLALGINVGLMTAASKYAAVGALFNADLRYATTTEGRDAIGGAPASAPASFAICGAALF